jgi:predicted nucleic acid-binding protein
MAVTLVNYAPGMTFVNSVYLDTNLLVSARDRKSQRYNSAAILLGDLFSNGVNLFITNLVIDEYIWALLKAYYRRDNKKELSPNIIKANPQVLLQYHWRIASGVKKILNFRRLTVASNLVPSKEIIVKAINLMRTQLLSPRDAFHLAFIIKLNIDGIVTSNGDFDNLNIRRKNLTIYKY